MTMMNFLRKNKKLVFSLTLIVFLVSIFFAGGSYYIVRGYNTVATVNGTRITYDNYQNTLERVLRNLREQSDNKTPITDDVVNTKKQEVLRDLIQEEVFTQIAKKFGIAVSDDELAADVQRFPAFQKDGVFDQQTYFRAIFYALQTTPEEFEESRRNSIMIAKLRQFIINSVTVPDGELMHAYTAEHKGDMINFGKDRDEFLKTYSQKKATQVMNDWFDKINAEIKIKTYLDRIEKRMRGQ